MEAVKKVALCEPLVDVVDKSLIITSISKILDFDLYTVRVSDVNFIRKYELKVTRDETIYALTAWFDIYFTRLNYPVKFTTSPYSRSTHWKQTVIYLPQPIRAKAGQKLMGTISVAKAAQNPRHLDIKIAYNYTDSENTVQFAQMYRLR